MDDGFGTRPPELMAAAGRFDEAAAVVAGAVAALHATLGGLGDYLGTDEQGRAFTARYEPAAQDGTTAFEREAGSLRALGEALRSTARDYDAGDTAVTSELRGTR